MIKHFVTLLMTAYQYFFIYCSCTKTVKPLMFLLMYMGEGGCIYYYIILDHGITKFEFEQQLS
jgi:hypothetical protein